MSDFLQIYKLFLFKKLIVSKISAVEIDRDKLGMGRKYFLYKNGLLQNGLPLKIAKFERIFER